MTTETLTAEDFARGITEMRFTDVMKVVDAINTANGYTGATRSRGKLDGVTLLSAAQAILEPGPERKAPSTPRDRKGPGSLKESSDA